MAFCDTIDEAVGIFTNPEMSNKLDNMIEDAKKRAEIFEKRQGVLEIIHLIIDRYKKIDTFELGSAMLPTQDRWTINFEPEKLDAARKKLMETVKDVILARTELSNLGENSKDINTLLEEPLRGVEDSRTAAINRIQDFMDKDFEKRKLTVDQHYGNKFVTQKIKEELDTILMLLKNN